MLFLSPRNSDEAQLSVVEQADCQTFLYSSSMSTRVEKLLQSHRRLSKMTRIVVPEQEDLLKDEFVPEILYDRTVDQARSEPLVILHTSRSYPHMWNWKEQALTAVVARPVYLRSFL